MQDTFPIQIAKRGLVTLPKALREAYKIQDGEQLTLLDLGGVFVLSRQSSEIDRISEQIRSSLVQKGESLESILQALREARQKYES